MLITAPLTLRGLSLPVLALNTQRLVQTGLTATEVRKLNVSIVS